MAQRYGGQYSPTGSGDRNVTADKPDTMPRPRGQYDGARVDPAGGKVNVLFVPPAVLVFTSIGKGAVALATGLAAAGILAASALLLREGLRAEGAYNARKVARKPALPRKILASLLTATGVGIAAWRNDGNIVAAGLYGAIAGALQLAAFGIDPLTDKGTEGVDDFQQGRVARAVDEAENYLTAMTDAVRRAGDRTVAARVERFQTTARELFRTVEEDPRDLTGARKYLGVYLMGARDAAAKFADIYTRTGDTGARADFLALLDDLEQNFAARTRKMLTDDRSDLTVEIEVLRERLQRDGVRLD
ncbi:MAG: 5-bromo-4-chloroindolyl phosphate hydrolysis family protein [Marinibacterium sp.]